MNSLNPKHFEVEHIEDLTEVVHEHVCFEMDLIELIHGIGHGPEYRYSCSYQQNKGMPYPKGRIYFIMTSRVPGENLEDICDELTHEQLRSVRKQLAKILNEMGKENKILNEERLSFFRYDRENDKL